MILHRGRTVARVERSATRVPQAPAPDFAALHPGYVFEAPRTMISTAAVSSIAMQT
jgi:hypothetical protein